MASTDERQPLLAPPPPTTEPGPPAPRSDATADANTDEEANTDGLDPADPLLAQQASEPVKKEVTVWKVLWWIIISAAIGVGVYFLVQALRESPKGKVSKQNITYIDSALMLVGDSLIGRKL